MPFFSKVFKNSHNSHSSALQGKSEVSHTRPHVLQREIPTDAWGRTRVAAEEVRELLHVCTQEMKSRALDTPFLLLPFRPESNLNLVQSFIRRFFQRGHGAYEVKRVQDLYHELRLSDLMILSSIVKWCWSRLAGGVVTWKTYELFRSGEQESRMTRNSFDTFIPLSVESEARQRIVFDFFDLLAAIAAHAKHNGLGGRKLSRLAGWWAFEHSDDGKGFDGGYRSWASAANATSHLFFAYLRSRTPDPATDTTGISHIPRSLQALVTQTDYPPETPASIQTWTSKVVMVVDAVSPTPHALLRRATQFDYLQEDDNLQQYARYDEPLDALTIECRRVLDCISSTNMTNSPISPTKSSWSHFEDSGFSSLNNSTHYVNDTKHSNSSREVSDNSLLNVKSTRYSIARPATPSWADFMSSGFSDDSTGRGPASLLVPPSIMLPPLGGRASLEHAHLHSPQEAIKFAELASISHLHLDETFWWVWMASLAGEETAERKAVFGRCAFVETNITGGRWLIFEEQVKGAVDEIPSPDTRIVAKKSRFSFGKITRTSRKSSGKQVAQTDEVRKVTPTTRSGTVGSEEQARVQAAAAAIVEKHRDEELAKAAVRRGRMNEDARANATSMLTMQPIKLSDVAPALQWARNFDKRETRAKYLGDLTVTSNLGFPTSPTSLNKALPVVPRQTSMVAHVHPTPPSPIRSPVGAHPVGELATPPSSPPDAYKTPSDTRQTNFDSPTSYAAISRDVSNVTLQPGTPVRTARKPVASPHESSETPIQMIFGDPPNAEKHARATESPPLPRPRVFQRSSSGTVRGIVNIFNRRKVDQTDASRTNGLSCHQARNTRAHDSLREEGSTLQVEPDLPTPPISSSPAVPTSIKIRTSTIDRPSEFEPQIYEPNHFYESPPQSPTSIELRDANRHHFRGFSSGGDEPTSPMTPDPPRWAQLPLSQSGGGFGFKTRAAVLLSPPLPLDLDANQAAHANDAAYTHSIEPPSPQLTDYSTADSDDAKSSHSIHVAPQPLPVVVADPTSFSHDRWAQIRKHAAERRVSEDRDAGIDARVFSSRGSVSVVGATEDADDTDASGPEEPIEVRVARIKARVAAITSNNNDIKNTYSNRVEPVSAARRWV